MTVFIAQDETSALPVRDVRFVQAETEEARKEMRWRDGILTIICFTLF